MTHAQGPTGQPRAVPDVPGGSRPGRRHPGRATRLTRASAILTCALALAAGLLGATGSASALNTNRTGAQDGRGFPRYYTDDSGLSLQLCEDRSPRCLGTGPGALVPPDGENFYWSASAELPSRRGTLSVELALEAAFTPNGRPLVFDRLRIRGHLDHGGRYVLRHPFGSKRFRAANPREQRNVNVTVDIPCSRVRGGGCQERIDTWLRSRRPRAGYVGRGDVPTRVVGGTVRNELVLRARGRGVIGRTRRFAVVGKVAAGPAAAISRPRVDLGNTARPRERTIVIRNLGTRRLHLRSIRKRGSDAFHVRRRLSSCRPQRNLRPGRTCELLVRYHPNGKRRAAARLVVRDNSPAHVHRIPMRATSAAVLHVRHRLHFTPRRVGSTSPARRVVVENTGARTLRIRSASLHGRNGNSFVRRSGRGPLCAQGTRLRPGDGCAVYVSFSPRTFGRKTSSLVFRSNSLGGRHRVRLNGRGR